MKIYFARHGDYQNPEDVVPYQLPGFHLSELGKKQVNLQAEKLLSCKIRTLSCSPVERCLHTATIIGKAIGLHPNIHQELIETYTPLQGKTKKEINKISTSYLYEVPDHLENGGETAEAIFERMTNFVSKLQQMSKHSSHVIVSHGDPLMIYLSKTLLKVIPHTYAEFYQTKIRYIPMGGLVMLDYSQSGIPKYTEII